jgi:hypothetical protein
MFRLVAIDPLTPELNLYINILGCLPIILLGILIFKGISLCMSFGVKGLSCLVVGFLRIR